MPMSVKIAGSWRDVTPYIKVAGSWRTVDKAWVKVAGTWRQIFAAYSPRIYLARQSDSPEVAIADSDGNLVDSTGLGNSCQDIKVAKNGHIFVNDGNSFLREYDENLNELGSRGVSFNDFDVDDNGIAYIALTNDYVESYDVANSQQIWTKNLTDNNDYTGSPSYLVYIKNPQINGFSTETIFATGSGSTWGVPGDGSNVSLGSDTLSDIQSMGGSLSYLLVGDNNQVRRSDETGITVYNDGNYINEVIGDDLDNVYFCSIGGGYVKKLDTNMNLVWTVLSSTIGNDCVTVTVDKEYNVYVGGRNFNTYPLVKLDPNGNILYQSTILQDNNNSANIPGIAVDPGTASSGSWSE